MNFGRSSVRWVVVVKLRLAEVCLEEPDLGMQVGWGLVEIVAGYLAA